MNTTIESTTNSTLSNLSGLVELSAFRLVLIQRINRIICSCLGIPLNISVVIVVLRSRQLWSPRNIFWLAVTLFNFIAVLESTTELVIYYLHQRSDGSHLVLCKIYSTQLGCPYGLLLVGLTLASWDRHLTLAHGHFYQDYATAKNAALVLLFSFLLVTGVELSPYWTGNFSIECGIRYKWLLVTLMFHGLLSSTCLVVQTRLFLFIRKCVRYAPAVENIQLERSYKHQTSVCSAHVEIHSESRIRDSKNGRRRKNRVEIQATQILGLGILPFCLVNLTLCVCGCVRATLDYGEFNTHTVRTVMKVCREIIRIHLIYIPTVFITQSREFRAAVKRFYRSRKSQSSEQFS